MHVQDSYTQYSLNMSRKATRPKPLSMVIIPCAAIRPLAIGVIEGDIGIYRCWGLGSGVWREGFAVVFGGDHFWCQANNPSEATIAKRRSYAFGPRNSGFRVEGCFGLKISFPPCWKPRVRILQGALQGACCDNPSALISVCIKTDRQNTMCIVPRVYSLGL